MQYVARMVKGWQVPGLAVAAAQDEVTSGDALLREIDGSANLAGVCHGLKDVDGHRIISPLVQCADAHGRCWLWSHDFGVRATERAALHEHARVIA